ncbi:hypothetical protein BH11PSE12_BH11PSE12_33230 [soil metagenome]
MQRRTFLFIPAAMAFAGTSFSSSNSRWTGTSPGIDVFGEITKLRITSGLFTGAYVMAPHASLNWYFANLGLLPIVQYLNSNELDMYIRGYLDQYLRRLEANFSIRDVAFSSGDPAGNYQLVLSDSDDAYAATFLSLVARYLKASENWAWWDANKQKLKDLAYLNLAVAAKPNGLTSVFQAPRNQTSNVGYL